MAKQKSLIYNSFFNVLYQLLNVIFPFVTAIYVSHILMAEGVGKVAYVQNIASYFVAIAPLGLASYGVKEIAKVKNNPVERNKCFSELFLINAVSTAILALIYYVTVFCMDSFTEDGMLFVVCGFPILLNFINVEWFYQGMEEYAYITVRSLFTKIASMLLMFLIVRNRNDYVQYALITSFVGSANRIFNMVYLRKFVTFRWINLDWKKHVKPMFILACNILLANIYSKVDITMLGYWKTDAITGYYANAFKILNIILSLCSAITDVFLPRLSYIFCGDRKKYSDLLNFGMKIVLTIIFPAFAGMVMLASSMIPIFFGNSFIPAVSTVQLLSLLILIKGFGNLACYQVAISSGNERKQTLAYVIGCVVNVVLNALLIPGLNQNGAAIASVISELVLNAVLFIQLRKISGIHIKWSYIWIVLKSCIIMMVFVEIVLKIIPGQSAPWSAIAVGVAVYAFSGYLQENQVIMDIFQKMINFIRKKHMAYLSGKNIWLNLDYSDSDLIFGRGVIAMQPEKLFNCMKKYIKKEWVICFISAVLFGLVAHLFKITNFIPNWDSLLNLYTDQNKTNLGRCFLGFACSFSTYYDLPWINGFLSLIYVGLSAVCVSELFEIKSRIPLVLIGGLMVTFPTVTSTLAYNYTADGYFLALLSICLAVIVCVRFHRGLLPAAVLIAFGLGIYQAYITFAMVLMLIYLVDELLFKQINMKQFWTMSCRFAVCGVLGGIGYWMSMKITVFISGIQLSEYQNIDKSFSLQEMNFFSSVLRAGYKFLKYFFDFSSGINLFLIINIILFSGLSILFLYSFWAQKTYRQFWRIFLTGMCLIAIPFASYALYFVNPILDYHNLMVMCLCLIYILPVLFYERLSELSDRMFIIKQWGILGLSALTIFNFILIANISYQKLYMSYEKSYGVIIRLADRIEQLPGALECNKLAVIGCLPGSESISVDFPPDMTGITDDYIIRKQDTMMQENVTQAMLQDYCGITFEDTTEDDICAVCKKEEFSQMNEWPEQNSVSVIGDILVVNFGGETDE